MAEIYKPRQQATALPHPTETPDAETIQWNDLARRYKQSQTFVVITLLAGIIFFPIWIASYIEYNKMEKIKAEVATLGRDSKEWVKSLRPNKRLHNRP
jgi:hypothetical protein